MRNIKHRSNKSRRTIIPKERATELLRPHIAHLWQFQKDAWDSWEEFGRLAPAIRKPLDETTRANIIWDHIKANALKHFNGTVPGVKAISKGHFFALDFNGELLVRFKKLTKTYQSHNVQTQCQLDLAAQIQTETQQLQGMPVNATWLTCGYVLDRFETAMEECAITCSIDTDLQYVISLAPSESVITEIPAAPVAGKKVIVSAKEVSTKKQKHEQFVK